MARRVLVDLVVVEVLVVVVLVATVLVRGAVAVFGRLQWHGGKVALTAAGRCCQLAVVVEFEEGAGIQQKIDTSS